MSALDLLGFLFMVVGIRHAALILLRRDWRAELMFRCHAPQVVANVLWAVDAHMEGDWVNFAIQSTLAGVNAYLAWNNRPRKKRHASRVAARVRDLGHRLTVVPASSPP